MSKIKLQIEIDEEIYKEAIRSGYSHLYDEDVANAVAAGIPILNERLINVEEVIKIANKTKDIQGAIWQASRYNIDTLRVTRSYPAALILDCNKHIIKNTVKRDLVNDLVSQMDKYITIETCFEPHMNHYNFIADVKVVRVESEV